MLKSPQNFKVRKLNENFNSRGRGDFKQDDSGGLDGVRLSDGYFREF